MLVLWLFVCKSLETFGSNSKITSTTEQGSQKVGFEVGNGYIATSLLQVLITMEKTEVESNDTYKYLFCGSPRESKQKTRWRKIAWRRSLYTVWVWSVYKSSFIFSTVMAERHESLRNPPHLHLPPHLIHMSICLLSMPLSKDHWCPAFDIWHIMCHVSSNELTQRSKKKKANCLHIPKSLTVPFLCSYSLILCRIEYYGLSASSVKCYLTSAGLVSNVSHLMLYTCHLEFDSWCDLAQRESH